ncbi:hypothetical protein F4804DRAFT_58629 [Jackrogersella minutella]|nr:hypothetical protein F4804DRAFT_58629 [Jackrogersella minutella]
MALEAHDRGFTLLAPPSKMKGVPQRPGPPGSLETKQSPMPRLGDGLGEILTTLLVSPAANQESITVTQSHSSISPTLTAPASSPNTSISTPNSSIGSPDIIQQHSASEQLKAASLDEDGHHISRFNVQHYELFLSTPTQSRPQLSPERSIDDDIFPYYTSQLYSKIPMTASSIHSTSAHAAAARVLQESSSRNNSALDKIIPWFLDGTLSSSGAKNMAKQYQYWDLLEALKATPSTTTQSGSRTSMRHLQKETPSITSTTPIENSSSHISNGVRSGSHSTHLEPIYVARDRFYRKLMKHVDTDKEISKPDEANLHLFVDMSNIFIGFCDTIKAIKKIPQSHRVPAPTFSFKVLALVMERGRNAHKRILAGSTPGYSAEDPRKFWPRYFSEADQLHYKMNIFCRVQTRKPSNPKRRGKRSPKSSPNDIHDLSTGESTGDDGVALNYEVRNGEQGVDENLHLNMMNSMWDHISCPGTMILATGDAAEAEFSNGFLQYATRALDKGWMIELVTWKLAISSAWTNPKFFEKYAGRFRIIFLDDFIEELQSNDLVP